MSEERKKPVWPWIAALLIGLPVLYLASFGPAYWLTGNASPFSDRENAYIAYCAFDAFYRPLWLLAEQSDVTQNAIWQYWHLWVREF